jgi:hypothetical protein
VSWGICPSGRHQAQIHRALRHGIANDDKRNNTCVTFNGEAERIGTFEGPRWHVTGRMTFEYYGTRVLAIDFDRDMVTDFGYIGYRMTTTQNISGWYHALRQTLFLGVRCLDYSVSALNWTISSRRNEKSLAHPSRQKTHEDKLMVKFRTGAPWVRRIDGDPWFDARAYDQAAVENAERVNREICDGLHWRWFTADWVNGLWTKQFINEDAESRWKAWRARREIC